MKTLTAAQSVTSFNNHLDVWSQEGSNTESMRRSHEVHSGFFSLKRIPVAADLHISKQVSDEQPPRSQVSFVSNMAIPQQPTLLADYTPIKEVDNPD